MEFELSILFQILIMTDLEKQLQRELKKNKKLEERFMLLAKDKAVLQKKLETLQLAFDSR